jgi:hypothetical protein
VTLAGNVLVKVDKALGQSNDFVTVSGTLTKTGAGTLTVTNLGTNALVIGDSFTVFSQPVTGGSLLSVTGAGVTWTNKLALNGSIEVLSLTAIASYPTNITFTASGGVLNLSWPATHLGWFLQTQTNALNVGLKTNWFDVPGSDSVTNRLITNNPANPTVFFRLRRP